MRTIVVMVGRPESMDTAIPPPLPRSHQFAAERYLSDVAGCFAPILPYDNVAAGATRERLGTWTYSERA